MASQSYQYYPQAPGQQNPGRYPIAPGANYQKWGEQSGWYYDPYQDKYFPDPNARKQYEIDAGLRPADPKQPSLTDALLPIGAGMIALEGGRQIGQGLPGLLSSVKEGIASLGSSATTPMTATPGANALPGIGLDAASTTMYPGGATFPAAPEAAASVVPESTGLLGAAAPLIAAGIAAYTAKEGYDAYKDSKGGLSGGIKGWKDSNPLIKYNPVLAGVPFLGGLLGHESTREAAKRHTASLLDQGKDDAAWQSYVQGMREQYNSDPTDPSKPFAGKYGSWDEYKNAGLEAADLTGVYGNLKTYGQQWAGLTQEQRQAITQANIDSGLYFSKKGEVDISDQEQAKKNLEVVLAGLQTENPKQATGLLNIPIPVNKEPAPLQPAGLLGRTQTLSPGIGLDGRRLSY